MIHVNGISISLLEYSTLEQQELVAQDEDLMKVRMKYMEAQNTEYVDEMFRVSHGDNYCTKLRYKLLPKIW